MLTNRKLLRWRSRREDLIRFSSLLPVSIDGTVKPVEMLELTNAKVINSGLKFSEQGDKNFLLVVVRHVCAGMIALK